MFKKNFASGSKGALTLLTKILRTFLICDCLLRCTGRLCCFILLELLDLLSHTERLCGFSLCGLLSAQTATVTSAR